ncbi:hypothetical protein HNY73_007256 [Argiope bruennichi]|uniref:Uncharacterized protein n=1 Tax=Argiope bruennichi TaxID=94029 RepID=A0A8T0FG14_ARGBR|nr:hypothetical protein HNY73_007256 [Argiope bruennichi]
MFGDNNKYHNAAAEPLIAGLPPLRCTNSRNSAKPPMCQKTVNASLVICVSETDGMASTAEARMAPGF